jgi:hypothetical protein
MRAPVASKLFVITALTGAFFSSSACSSDEKPSGSPDGGTGGSEETGGKGNGGSSMGGKGGTGGTGAAGGDSGTCTGGPSKGTNDAGHCKEADGGAIKQEIGACTSEPADAGGGSADAGAGDDYGDTLYGVEGIDDDCKYHVMYRVTPICQDEGTTFVITLTKTSDGKPATGAAPYIEATLNGLPAGVADKQKPTEKAGGVYEVGPVVFDKPGKWVARFHFFETCADAEDSPHGHVAFFMDVP